IYGPGRHYLLDQLRRGDRQIAGSGELHLNLIHRADAAAAVLAVLAPVGPGCLTYNVADGRPSPKTEVVGWLAERLGLSTPEFHPAAAGPRAAARGGPVPDRIIVADSLRQATGWAPQFTDYRQGYAPLLD